MVHQYQPEDYHLKLPCHRFDAVMKVVEGVQLFAIFLLGAFDR